MRARTKSAVRLLLAVEVHLHWALIFALVDAVHRCGREHHVTCLQQDAVIFDVFRDHATFVDERKAPEQFLADHRQTVGILVNFFHYLGVLSQMREANRNEVQHRVEPTQQHDRDQAVLLIRGQRPPVDSGMGNSADNVVAGIGGAFRQNRRNIIVQRLLPPHQAIGHFFGRAFGFHHHCHVAEQLVCILVRQFGEREEHLDGEDIRQLRFQFAMSIAGERLNQFDRQRPDLRFHGHDLVTTHVTVQYLAIGRMFRRIEHGRQPVPFCAHRLGNEEYLAGETGIVLQHL